MASQIKISQIKQGDTNTKQAGTRLIYQLNKKFWKFIIDVGHKCVYEDNITTWQRGSMISDMVN